MTFGQLRFQLMKEAPATDPDVLDQKINDVYCDRIGRHISWKALEKDAAFVTSAAFPGPLEPWQASTAYALNALVTDTKGHYQRVSTAGTSGSSTPAWNDSGGTTTDGSVIWIDEGSDGPSIAVTQGSQDITLSGAAWSSAFNGFGMRIDGRSETYYFTYVSATTATIDRAYEGWTNASVGFELFENLYELASDYGEPIRGRNERLPMALEYWDRALLDESVPTRTLILGEPVAWCEASRDSSGNRWAELFPPPVAAASYPYRYRAVLQPFSSSATSTVIPSWISIRGLKAGVLADLGVNVVVNNSIFDAELSQMRREDASARGAQKIRINNHWTRHRFRRAADTYRRFPGGG